jgi:hypothetical protein
MTALAAVASAAVVTPVVVAGDSIMGGVRGAASGFNTMVEPFNDYLTDDNNSPVLRAVVAPVAVVSGTAVVKKTCTHKS